MKDKKIKKVLKSIQNGEISAKQLKEILAENPELKDIIDLVNPEVTWKKHPMYPFVESSSNGQIKVSGELVKPRVWDGLLKVTLQYGKKRLYAALLILQCWEPCPGKLTDYTVGYIDDNVNNLKPSNLYWKAKK